MGDDSSTGGTHAFADGIGRVAAAPAVLAGTVAIVWLYGAPPDLRHWTGALVIWTILSGGVLDRYARRRPTRSAGFFAACGAHLGAMVRLALLMIVLFATFHLIVRERFENPAVHETGFVLGLLIALVVVYGQVRIAVEDRRSAIGAFVAAARFVARHPATLVIYVIYVAATLAIMLLYEQIVPGRHTDTWPAFAAAEALIAAGVFVVLAAYASGVSLFQSRLAHAGYTAAPPLTWPDSPGAEAITNAAPIKTS